MLWVIEDLCRPAARDELPLVADDDIFEAVLAIVITGICKRAPQPCTCGAHPGGAAPD